MRRILESAFILVLFCVFFSAATDDAAKASEEGSLDGRTFTVKVTEEGRDEEGSNDELIFKDGTFFSSECEQYGFSPAPYSESSGSGATTFESTLVSAKEGETRWKGSVTGDRISGSFVWSKEDQSPITYSYEGTLKQ